MGRAGSEKGVGAGPSPTPTLLTHGDSVEAAAEGNEVQTDVTVLGDHQLQGPDTCTVTGLEHDRLEAG